MTSTTMNHVFADLWRRTTALGLALLLSIGTVGCSDDDPASPALNDEPAEGLMELFLNARTVDDLPLVSDSNGEINVRVDEAFTLELSYADLRDPDSRLGAFQIYVDLLTNQPNVLQPILSETLRLIIGVEIADAVLDDPSGTLTFSMEGSTASYESSGTDFANDSRQELLRAMEAFGYTLDEDFSLRGLDLSPKSARTELSSPPYSVGTKASDLGFEIHWDIDQYGNQDMPDISVTPDFAQAVPTQTVEFSPFGADGVTPNSGALRFNLDVRSRSFDANDPFYAANNRGAFDAATGFADVGGMGSIVGGGIPSLTDDGEFPQPFDAFSLRVVITAPVTGLAITALPGQVTESILLYGLDEAVVPGDVWLDGDNGVTINATP